MRFEAYLPLVERPAFLMDFSPLFLTIMGVWRALFGRSCRPTHLTLQLQNRSHFVSISLETRDTSDKHNVIFPDDHVYNEATPIMSCLVIIYMMDPGRKSILIPLPWNKIKRIGTKQNENRSVAN
jgi:hypothetical protein